MVARNEVDMEGDHHWDFFQSEIVAIEGYLQFQHVNFV